MNWSTPKYPLIINPYDSFMKKHLEHYGYFTGRNMAIARFGYEPRRGVKNVNESDDSDFESDDSENSNNNNKIKKKIDWANKNSKKSENYKWWLKDNVYNFGKKELEYQREPRWPVEMQVLPEKIRHIDTVFNESEPFYVKTGNEEMPIYKSEQKTKTVFYYNPVNCGYFIRSRVGGNRESCPRLTCDLSEMEMCNTLLFESRFESGNLMKAVKINEYEYELTLRYDLYTSKHTQWFYFQIKNAKPNVEYRFTIANFMKSDSLYNMGMKPLMYSELDAKNKNIGWRRWGTSIRYYKNTQKVEDQNGNLKSLYSLTWVCKFPNENDTYYFAHCYPYTYTDLQDYIANIQQDPVKSKYCKVKILCRTLAENLVHLLTITNPSSTDEENANKKAIVLSARVHPGETNSSWMMKGFLDFLLGNLPDAKLLRDTFIFKIVPMLNPDGVIIGNYRCSLTGRDLNRNYKTVLKEAFPSIWHMREMVKKLNQEREILLYCDLHGHSRKNNVFIYGCHNNNNPKKRFQEHVFPMILSKNAKDLFSYKSCKFKIQKSKQGTGRIVMWNMGIMNSFTLEATFSGSTLNQKSGNHFNSHDLEQLACHFCDSILDYCDPDQTKCKLIMNEIEALLKEQIRSKLESQGINVDQINLLDDLDKFNIQLDEEEQESSDDAGSDSSADDGLPLHLERFAKMRQRKKRKVKTRKTVAQPPTKPSKEQASNKLPNTQVNNIPNSPNSHNYNANNNNNAIVNNNNHHHNKNNNSSNLAVELTQSRDNITSKVNLLYSQLNNEKEKKDKSQSVGSNLNNLITTKQSNETLLKETEKKLLKTTLSSSSQGDKLSHPRSGKQSSEKNDDRFIKKINPNAIQLHLDTESAQYQPDPNFMTFRYTVPNEVHIPGNFYPHNHLCEHHRKKLSDLFLLKNLTNGVKSESDGEASDDEAEQDDDILNFNKEQSKPTLEEFVKRHVLTEVTPLKSQRRVKTSQSFIQTSNRIRPVQDQNEVKIQRLDDSRILTADYFKNNDSKSVMDYMPKTVLRQINERKVLNNAGNMIMSNANVIAPYNFYNSKNTNEIVENLTRDLNRKATTKTSKIQAQIIYQQQQQQQSLNSSNNVKQKLHTSVSANNLTNWNGDTGSPLVSNSTNSATLFSTAFFNGNTQLKNHFEKITRSNNNNSSMIMSTANTNIRPKVFK
ncbi:unnamed protein product [Brachionus calyciflorus]|uniref:Peptidase M14 domain-containing protein n=1 Tax=Brachionus calyciflorus TaxID=104777 RepID=A0A813M7A7_9BILA|nr:unnamed protein product [Brachionus calyciflorus]